VVSFGRLLKKYLFSWLGKADLSHYFVRYLLDHTMKKRQGANHSLEESPQRE
jgi:hypothetical protein